MQINTGALPLCPVNADRQAPDSPEAFGSSEAGDSEDLLSECALTMLVDETGPVRLFVLDLPPGLQLGDEDEQPTEE